MIPFDIPRLCAGAGMKLRIAIAAWLILCA